jgi:hypothetical protein
MDGSHDTTHLRREAALHLVGNLQNAEQLSIGILEGGHE